jgi:hypothetical protein
MVPFFASSERALRTAISENGGIKSTLEKAQPLPRLYILASILFETDCM